MSASMNHCEEMAPLISALIDDELSVAELASVTDHLETCESCRGMYRRFSDLNERSQLELPAKFDLRLAEDWRGEIDERVRRRRFRKRLSWAGTLAAAALVLISAMLVVSSLKDAEPVSEIASNDNGASNESNAMHARSVDSSSANVVSQATRRSGAAVLNSLETLQVISRQEGRTYESMRQLMELDLRALRLELKHMDLDPQQLEELSRRIDALILQIEQLEERPNQQETGASI